VPLKCLYYIALTFIIGARPPPAKKSSESIGGFNTRVLDQANSMKAYRNDNTPKQDEDSSDSDDNWDDEPHITSTTANNSYNT